MAINFHFSCAFLFIFIISYPVAGLDRSDKYITKTTIAKIMHDLPSYIDLTVFVPLLQRLVGFIEEHKKLLSVNLVHGLFLLKVNLAQFTNDKDIPESLEDDIIELISRADNLRNEYQSSKNGTLKEIIEALASNATAWSKRLPTLNFGLLKKTLAHGDYPLWHRYEEIVEDVAKGSPEPKLSDKCLGSLLESEVSYFDPQRRCEVPGPCLEALLRGSDLGYWLTHRIIFLLHARLSRNCVIFSYDDDKEIRQDLCERVYRETEYIAQHGFPVADLPLEQIAICALDGHAQFLRRSWLLNLMEYQQPSGCFQLYRVTPDKEPVLKDCQDHNMAVALGTYSAAVRFVLDSLKGLIK